MEFNYRSSGLGFLGFRISRVTFRRVGVYRVSCLGFRV